MDRELLPKINALKEKFEMMKEILHELVDLKSQNEDVNKVFMAREKQLKTIFIFDKDNNIIN